MGLLRARVMSVVVCLSLIPVVAAFVGCARSRQQVEETVAPVEVNEEEPVDTAAAEEAPAAVEEPAEAPSAPAAEAKAKAPAPKAEAAAKAAESSRPPARAEEAKEPREPAEKPPEADTTEAGSGGPAVRPEQPVAETPASPGRATPEEKPKGTVIVGQIEVVSNVPEPSSVPYDTCVTFIKYRVDSVESGNYDGKELLAVFWGMKDGKLKPAARFSVGQRHRLTIQPFAERKELARVMQADDTNEYSLTPYWVVKYTEE